MASESSAAVRKAEDLVATPPPTKLFKFGSPKPAMLEDGAAAPLDLAQFHANDIKGMLGALHENLALKIQATQDATSSLSSEIGTLREQVTNTQFRVDGVDSSLSSLKSEVEKVKAQVGGLDDLVASKVKAALGASSAGAAGSKGDGKGKNSQVQLEKKARTVYFRGFPDGLTGDDIKVWITRRMTGVKDIEEVYSFGDFKGAGAARFQEEEQMWNYLIDNKGKLRFPFAENMHVTASADSKVHGQDPDKNKAVRKCVRAIIEAHGGNGEMLLKTRLSRDYGAGLVKWRAEADGEWEKVGCWDAEAQCLVLSGEAKKHEQVFLALMGKA